MADIPQGQACPGQHQNMVPSHPYHGKAIDVAIFRRRDRMGKVDVLEACRWFDALGFQPEFDALKERGDYEKIMVEKGFGYIDEYGRFKYK
ncbi:MAG: hypothetical protein HC888_03040 [Candidatus Competibacteraceae bacterium]|nr:hypothetical protein [Candidatus Competibacteraceae bacterium]